MILEPCKGVHCVDLGESFQTHSYLQNLALIQPRKSPPKFGRAPDCEQELQKIQNVLNFCEKFFDKFFEMSLICFRKSVWKCFKFVPKNAKRQKISNIDI